MSADTGSARSGEQLHGELLRRWSEAKAAEKVRRALALIHILLRSTPYSKLCAQGISSASRVENTNLIDMFQSSNSIH